MFDLRRREFITLLGGAAVAWPVAARAQSAENVRRVGILWPGASPPVSPRLESFREGLREAGYIEGQNLAIELRYSQKGLEHLPELAAELVRLKVEVIQASGDFAPRVAQQATSTIPIVAFTDDVLGAGLVTNLSRPGGNHRGDDPCAGAQREAAGLSEREFRPIQRQSEDPNDQVR
jgi:putative ABC transport system substrate-binding protein